MPTPLQKAEFRLQTLLEKGFGKLSKSGLISNLIAQIILEMSDLTRGGKNSLRLAPDQFKISASSKTWKKLQADPHWMEKVIRALKNETSDSGVTFQSPLRIDPLIDDSLTPEEFTIDCQWQSDTTGSTQSIDNRAEKSTLVVPIGRDFLIIGNTLIFKLESPLINLGRRASNDLVLDDPRISRRHAQIRLIDGSFSIFDLGSTGGTFVNGQPVSSRVLNPGDVISLAGFPIIFNREGDVSETDRMLVTPSTKKEVQE
jgi:pSer/pThr/pTyr-binding forkhead associated (FHA) protein